MAVFLGTLVLIASGLFKSVLHSMQTFNNTSTAGSLDILDSTLYTSIPIPFRYENITR